MKPGTSSSRFPATGGFRAAAEVRRRAEGSSPVAIVMAGAWAAASRIGSVDGIGSRLRPA